MKVVLFFAAALALGYAVEIDECYQNVVQTCSNSLSKQSGILSRCDARYGAISSLEPGLQKFGNSLIHKSFDFLLMATHYGNYIKNRPGFEKLFRGFSDELWQDGIETIKYISSRGGSMNFANFDIETSPKPSLEQFELHSIGRALDIEKTIAEQTFELHKDASGHRSEHHDPEIAHHLEEKFMEKHRDHVRSLAGYAKDLSRIMDGPDASLGLYLFDEYLQK